MRNRSTSLALAAALLICLVPAPGNAQLVPYEQDFELLFQTDTAALGNDGWLYFGNVFSPDGSTYLYGYGPGPAPNDPFAPAFSGIVLLEGGATQGIQQLTVFSDYNNLDHAVLNLIESNVFQEQTIAAANIGERWVFQFDAKMGNLVAPSTAAAFIKTLDPGAGYALTNYLTVDMTEIPADWGHYWLAIEIDASLDGQLLQIGFVNTATNYESSGIFYDNIDFAVNYVTAAPENTVVRQATLAQNFPNPFNPTTQIEFSLPEAGNVDISVYDLAGRRVATLHQGNLGAGGHVVDWNGRTDDGVGVASGHYRYVLRTAQGELARGMTLLK